MSGLRESQEVPLIRAALYIDGFNLYHPIRIMGAGNAHLKWSSLWQLGENLTRPRSQTLVKTVFCTAVPTMRQNADKRGRHIRFNDAQRACGVTVIEGHYVPEPIEEDGIPTGRTKWTEKQTDINVALELIIDGLNDVYDVALLLSADTDQVATARVFSESVRPLGKTLVGVAPPNRAAPIGYSAYQVASVELKQYDIERCVMPEWVEGNGIRVQRPAEYEPTDGWVHPDNRPKGRPAKVPKGVRL